MRSAGWLFMVVAALLVAGAGRLAYIEYAEGESLHERADRRHTATLVIPAQRGDILDAQARLLAGSESWPSIYADPSLLQDPRDRKFAAYSVAPVLGLAPEEVDALLRDRCESRFAWLKRHVNAEELAAFHKVRNARRLYALDVQHEPERIYPHGRLAAHVLGFVGTPEEGVRHGLAGIEFSQDQYLVGTAGRRCRTVDARRRGLRSHVDGFVPPQDGATIILTIDAYLQEQTESHLKNAVETFKAAWGTAVVMDPLTGEVLAMASYPDFDPADPLPDGGKAGELDVRLRNRAISDAYEPGSVFKPFIASCAVDDGVTRLDEVFAVNGPAHNFGRRVIHDTHAYGSLPLHEVISRSSNIGMAMLGTRCQGERLYRYLRLWGFGDRTGIELPGEHTGIVQDFSRWTNYSCQSVPIGQEVSVTALQIATAFSVFANGGILFRPRIVRGILGPDGEPILDNSRPIPVRRVLSRETAERFREEALIEVVMSKIGTGKRAQIPNYRVFGKTGTAQIARKGGGGYMPGKYTGSFVGGAPGDKPRVVAVVSLSAPSSGRYYGGTVSAPAVGEILADTLAYMQVPPEVTSANEKGIMPGRKAGSGVQDAGGW
jgi:cell division protein FtsI/penicillin-binding protein 2